MNTKTKTLIQQIVSSSDLIKEYTNGISEKDLGQSTEKQDAVVRRIQIISEITQNIPAPTKKENSHIAWDTMAELSQTVINNHIDLDSASLWKTIQATLPEYVQNLEKLLIIPTKRIFSKDMFQGDDVRMVAKNLLGCVIHFPETKFPVKQGTITDVQWYDLEGKDVETTEDKQGDALLVKPGKIFFFESMGNMVLLISALSEQTRACVRINAVDGIADKPQMVVRALGITSFDRDKHQFTDILKKGNLLYITPAEIEIPEPEVFQPRHSRYEKGMRITLPSTKNK